MNLLPQSNNRKPALTDALFENGGNLTAAAEVAGYSKGSVAWLRDRLADEIVERTRSLLAGHSLKAANKIASLVDNPDIERGDDLRMKAAESILNRVGLGKQETMNHNVTAVHGVVLLPPKKEVVIDG